MPYLVYHALTDTFMLNPEFWGNPKHLIPISYNLLNLVMDHTHITLNLTSVVFQAR